MGKIILTQIAVAASIDDTWEVLAVDSRGRLWRMNNQDEFTQIELPDEPSTPYSSEKEGNDGR